MNFGDDPAGDETAFFNAVRHVVVMADFFDPAASVAYGKAGRMGVGATFMRRMANDIGVQAFDPVDHAASA